MDNLLKSNKIIKDAITGISNICMKQLTESQKINNYIFSEECRVELTRAEKMVGETMNRQKEL